MSSNDENPALRLNLRILAWLHLLEATMRANPALLLRGMALPAPADPPIMTQVYDVRSSRTILPGGRGCGQRLDRLAAELILEDPSVSGKGIQILHSLAGWRASECPHPA
ncbi:MAG TPA: hypothetical protein VJK02_09460 [Anaerolineales bacterium]|nr:hypothetical protein [Anaerolineales bacterium]